MDSKDQETLNRAEAIETVLNVLREGHSVELPATGYSMFPAIRPGERVVVRPVGKDETLEKGAVVVCYEDGAAAQRRKGAKAEEHSSVFLMHRLIEVRKDDAGNVILITRGDSLEWADEPWQIDQLIGIAVSRKSGNKEWKIKCFVPSGLRYRVNWWLLWGYGKWFRVSRFVQ
jgi:hypothetical protein